MRRLTGLDSVFLALETPTSTGHVGGLSILDPRTAPETVDLAALTRLIGSRIDRVPVLRERLMEVPLGIDQPVWVDDEHFDIGYHVRELGLPKPGSDAQLSEQISRIHARPLDRTRPLWETYLIHGLRRGRIAVYTKVHHAAIDGVSGAELLTLLTDLSPVAPPPADPEGDDYAFHARPAPSRLRLGAESAVRLAMRPLEVAKITVDAVRAIPALGPIVAPALGPVVANLIGLRNSGGGDGQVLEAATPIVAPPTPLNVAISPHRRYAFGSLSLPDVKFVKNTFGVSVNDVVMAMCAGALRRWLIDHDALPDGPLVAMVPVSIRSADHGPGGNHVSAMLAALPTHLDDPLDRLEVTRRATQTAKAQQAFIPQGLVDEVSDFAPPAFTARAARVMFASRLLHRLPAFNTVISNVPGPNVPIYLAGAKLLAHYPVSVVVDGVALNITLIGYLDQLHFGLIAAREVMPDLDEVMGHLDGELATLVTAARTAATKAAKTAAKPTAKPIAKSTPRTAKDQPVPPATP